MEQMSVVVRSTIMEIDPTPDRRPGPGERLCPRCGGIKAVEDFSPKPDGTAGTYCRPCFNAMQVKARKAKPERYRRTLDYNNAWLKQNAHLNRQSQQRWRDRQRERRQGGSGQLGAGMA
jgi:hypothetical protein